MHIPKSKTILPGENIKTNLNSDENKNKSGFEIYNS